MAEYQGMQSFKAENQRKTVLLIVLFPIFLFLVLWVVLTLCTEVASREEGLDVTLQLFPFVIIGILIWGTVSFFFQKDIMFGLSGAKEITRKENPELYNIVENLCISKGLPMPKIAIMHEAGMNAFATGWRQKDSWIAFTSGLLENLDKREIEAVAGHELTHLINKDSLLMYVAFVFIGIMTVVGQFFFRIALNSSSRSSRDSGKGRFFMLGLGLAFLILGYLLYPLVRLAISRKREYLADLGSVELTKDSQSMISALRKISTNSYMSKADSSISSFFIAQPNATVSDVAKDEYGMGNYASSGGKTKTSIWDSHPSIDDRIARLQNY